MVILLSFISSIFYSAAVYSVTFYSRVFYFSNIYSITFYSFCYINQINKIKETSISQRDIKKYNRTEVFYNRILSLFILNPN